jgi:hypothetical protein
MKLKGLDRRLAELESKAEPVKLRLLCYDEEQKPPEPVRSGLNSNDWMRFDNEEQCIQQVSGGP